MIFFSILVLSPKFVMESSGRLNLDQIYDSHQQVTEGKLQDKIYDTRTMGKLESHQKQPTPTFVSEHSGDVTAILGKTAILNCRVTGVGNRLDFLNYGCVPTKNAGILLNFIILFHCSTHE